MAQFELDEGMTNQARIKVIGAGGGGGNAVNTMIEAGTGGVEFIAANTDAQVLLGNLAGTKLQLGSILTKGLGAGGNPDVGRDSALEERDRIAEVITGADMVFVTAGMGGGPGTGAAPVIAQIARELGILTVGVVTRPFPFEGPRRARQADDGIATLGQVVDCLLVIPNQKLLQLAGQRMALADAFRMANEVLLNAVRGICDIITVPGLINVDFADVRTVMINKGRALMGTGRASGEHRAIEAAQQALTSPLLEDVAIQGATGVLVNITGAADLTLNEVAEASEMITKAASPEAHCIIGSVIDANMRDEVHITVVATGFDQTVERSVLRQAPAGPPPVPRRNQMALSLESEIDFGNSAGVDPLSVTARIRRDTGSQPSVRAQNPFTPEDHTHLDTPTFLRKHSPE